jgi:predicted component of type VI protein secretion system
MNWKVDWQDGEMLTAAHFNTAYGLLHDSAWQLVNAYSPNHWGIIKFNLDEEKLNHGCICINKLTAILPNGAFLTVDKLELILSSQTQSDYVYLTLLNTYDYKFKNNIKLRQPRPTLTTNKSDNGNHICIAKIKSHHLSGKLTLDNCYLPPIINLYEYDSGKNLVKNLISTLESLEEKNLTQELLTLQLAKINNHLPPYTLYQICFNLIKKTQSPIVIPAYQQDQLTACLYLPAKTWIEKNSHTHTTEYLAFEFNNDYWEVSAPFTKHATLKIPTKHQTPCIFKLAPISQINSIVKNSLTGIQCQFQKINNGFQYYLINSEDPLWSISQHEKNLALHIDQHILNEAPQLCLN